MYEGGASGRDGDGPGYPFNNNNNNGWYGGSNKDNGSPGGKKRGRNSSSSRKNDYYSSNNCTSLNSPNNNSEDTTAAETSVGSDSLISGFTNPSSNFPPRQGGGGGGGAVMRQQQQEEEDNPVSSGGAIAVATAAETSQQGNVVATTVDSNVNNPNNIGIDGQLMTAEEQRTQLIRQLRHVGMATGSTFVVAILSIVPIPVLVAFFVCSMALVGFLYKLYQAMLFELNFMQQRRGIGDYLPSSIYEQLTRTTLHEYMSDRSTINENAYLLLYMIPGLSRDQIDAYVGRLAPRHQNTLHRRGLGNFLGPGFMRLIVGDERLSAESQQQRLQNTSNASVDSSATSTDGLSAATNSSPVVPRRLVLPPTIPEEVADDTSDLGEEEDPTNVPVLSIQVQHSDSGSSASPTQSEAAQEQDAPQTEETIRAETEVEEQVIYDAIGSAITTYMGVAAGMVQASARRSAGIFSGTLFRASFSATAFGVGLSIYGFWTGAYNPQTFFRPTMRMLGEQMSSLLRPARSLHPQMPSSNVLVTSTLFSGATAGILLLFQIAQVSNSATEVDDHDDDGDNKDDGSEQKGFGNDTTHPNKPHGNMNM